MIANIAQDGQGTVKRLGSWKTGCEIQNLEVSITKDTS